MITRDEAVTRNRCGAACRSARFVGSGLILLDELELLLQKAERSVVVNRKRGHDGEHGEDEDDGETALSRAVGSVALGFGIHFLKLVVSGDRDKAEQRF